MPIDYNISSINLTWTSNISWITTKVIKNPNRPITVDNIAEGELLETLNKANRDKYSTNPLRDYNISPNKLYYYAIIPYDNTDSVIVSDIINLSCTLNNNLIINPTIAKNGKNIEIMWEDVGIPTNWAGIKVIKKMGFAPVNIIDGSLVKNITISNKYKINPLVDLYSDLNTNLIPGEHYYYGIFPYDDVRNYNYDTVIDINYTDTFSLPNISSAEIVQNFNTIEIKWTDPINSNLNIPDDWAGTKLVRKINSAPTSESDGDLITHYSGTMNKNKYQLNPFVDSNVNFETTYCYGIFTYDTSNNYNYSTLLYQTLNYYIKPELTLNQGTIKITWPSLAFDTNTFTSFGKFKLVRKIDSIPLNDTDGEYFWDNLTTTEIIDNVNLIPTTTYFYRVFSYDTNGVLYPIEQNYNNIEFYNTNNYNIINPTIIQNLNNIEINYGDTTDIHWFGTKIVKKINSAPVDINDGVIINDSIVRDEFISTPFINSNVSGHIYYGIFPYDINNNYNYNTVLDILVDLTPTGNITNTNIAQNLNRVEIEYTDPTDSDWKSTYIVKKIGSAPTNINDGTIINTSTIRNEFKTTSFTNIVSGDNVFYYGIFTIDNNNNYNYNTVLNITIYLAPTANITGTSIIQNLNKIEIKYSDPNDTDWKYTYIVKNENHIPIDINDGTIINTSTIRNEYKTNPFIDTISTGNYHYGIFTVDNYNNYNYNTVLNILVDLTPTLNITNINIIQNSYKIEINYTDPTDIDWKSTYIVKKIGSAPLNINDGILINTSTIRNEYILSSFFDIDNFIDGTIYYYGIFTVDNNKNYNYGAVASIAFSDAFPTSNITNINITQNLNKIEIKYSDPNDTDWKETYIIKNENHIPVNINDGIIINTSNVLNEFKINPYTDNSDFEINKIYYYGIFTVDNYNNYNYNTTSNILFTYIDITDTNILQNFGQIELRWTEPVTINWLKTYIVKKSGSAPININDGTILEEIIEKNKYNNSPFIDSTNLVHNTTYYYGIFTLDINGKYNYNTVLLQTMSDIMILQNFYNLKIYWNESCDPNWTHTKVIKKIGVPSLNINDGELLETITIPNKYQTTPLIDYNVESSKIYFYTLFQYYGDALLSIINKSSQLINSDIISTDIVQNGHAIDIHWTDTNHYDWAGTKIIKTINTPPIDINDPNGSILEDVIIHNKYQTNPFTDLNTIPNTLYFYGIFSYDSDGNYNYNTVISKFFEDKFPTEDISYPSIIQNIDHFEIHWSDPLTSDWKGTKLIKKLNTQPLNETDGELLEDITVLDKYENTPFIDSNVVVNQTYCYGIFPYDNGINGTNINYNYNTVLYKTLTHYIKVNLLQNYNNITVSWIDLDFTNWDGSILVRKEGSVPLNSTDGVILEDVKIKNKYRSNPFIDVNNFTIGSTYYYGVFSYNKLGEFYDYVKYCVSSITFQDQFQLENILNPTIEQDFDVINLNWENPIDIRRAGIRILRKESSTPLNESDGDILIDITDENINSYVDAPPNLETTYYYGIFPFNANGNFNTDTILTVYFNDIIIRNIQNPTLEFKDNKIQLKWEDPDIADWVGTKVVRKIGSSPLNETDGELIKHYFGTINKNKYKINALLDPYPEIEYNNTYYYGIFPYDNNSYNYNTILSKDLHILNVTNLEISQSSTNEQLYISYGDPDSSDWNRTKIIRKIGSIPQNETDGVVVINSIVRNQYKDSFFTDTGVIPGQYYGYKAITYDRFNNVNRIAASATASPNLILDFDYEHMFNYYENGGWNIITQPYINDASGTHVSCYIRASGKPTKTFTIKNVVVPNGKLGTLHFGYDFYQCKYESKAHFKVLVNGFLIFSLNPLADEAAFETNKQIQLQTGNNIVQFIYYGEKELHFPPYINIYNLRILFN